MPPYMYLGGRGAVGLPGTAGCSWTGARRDERAVSGGMMRCDPWAGDWGVGGTGGLPGCRHRSGGSASSPCTG